MKSSVIALAALSLLGAAVVRAEQTCRKASGTADAVERDDRNSGPVHLRMDEIVRAGDLETTIVEGPTPNQDGTMTVALEQRFVFPDGAGFLSVLRTRATPRDDGAFNLAGTALVQETHGTLAGTSGSLDYAGRVAFSPFSSSLTITGQLCQAGGQQ